MSNENVQMAACLGYQILLVRIPKRSSPTLITDFEICPTPMVYPSFVAIKSKALATYTVTVGNLVGHFHTGDVETERGPGVYKVVTGYVAVLADSMVN